MNYTIALAGNPNSGKTSLFNELTGSKQHVGNWPGVTVDKKEGTYKKNKNIIIQDLPGTYSLSPYSAEEVIARDYIVRERPDAVINIVDGTNIERNLYLTLQIAETKIPMVVALNMMDEVEAAGTKINFEKLYDVLGIPVVPIVARSGKNIDKLMEEAEKVAEKKLGAKDLKVFDSTITSAIDRVYDILYGYEGVGGKSGSVTGINTLIYWKAIKIVENDEIVTSELSSEEKNAVAEIVKEAEDLSDGDAEAKIADLRYKFISRMVKESVIKQTNKAHVETNSDKLDKILTNRFLALPLFAVVMYVMFAATFSENFLFIKGLPSPGVWLAGVVETLWGYVGSGIEVLISGASPWEIGRAHV